MKINLFYDLVCPWCYIGHTRLHAALAAYPAGKVAVEYRPFQLAPDLPREMPKSEYFGQRGIDPDAVAKGNAKATAIGKALGIDIDGSRSTTACNTRDAHRLVLWAPAEKKAALIGALYDAYHGKGNSLADVAALAAAAAQADVAGEAAARAFLEGNELVNELKQQVQQAYQLPVITVPFMVIDDRFPVQFVHLPEVAEFALLNMYEG